METEGKALDTSLIGPGVSRLLGDSSRGRYWVAELGDEIIGQIMVTYEWSDWRNGQWWMIQSVYIHEAHRRQGVFSALYKHVKSLAQANKDVCGIRLYVEHDNDAAQMTYGSLGMSKTGYTMMEADFRLEEPPEC